MLIETRVFGEYVLKISVHKSSWRICYKFLKKHSIKVDLNCLDPGNVHLNNLNAPVLNVLINIRILLCLTILALPSRTALFWVMTQRVPIIYYRIFETTDHSVSMFVLGLASDSSYWSLIFEDFPSK